MDNGLEARDGERETDRQADRQRGGGGMKDREEINKRQSEKKQIERW